MAFVGEALVTKIMEKLIEVGFNYLADKWHAGGMKDELQRLNDALPHIQAVVAAADNAWTFEQQTANPGLQAWLQQFKDALYEADDALDELEYLRLQKQVEMDDDKRDENHNKVPHWFSNSKQSIIKFGKPFFKPDTTLKNLRRAVKRLVEVTARVGDFVALVAIGQQAQNQQHLSFRATGSLVTENKVFGRDKERKELLQWLMNDQQVQDDQNNVSLYSVVGVGGMGKTTLVQLVYNDENVQKYFDLKMWVCVSTSFDVTRITKAMLESATKNKPNIDNLDPLQVALKDKLMSSNKFFLVLDDVWDDQKNCPNWDILLAPLRHGHKGSKILLTTRMDKVAKQAARAMARSTKESMQLKSICGDDFFSLFNRYAFASVSSGDYTELQPIGKKIAERLGGSPLAAKIIGAILNSNLVDWYWRSILHCENISDSEDNIMSILMLSYHHLPLYLRPCFAFCGTFPQDYKFDKEDLVLKWMALGLIQHSPQNQGRTPEDIGSYYFDELFNRSFFEREKGFDSECYYIMHDLLHDVARSVSHGECFSIVDDDKSVVDIPNTVRHLYLATDNPNIVMMVDKYWQQLRSLQLRINYGVLPDEVLKKVFKSLKCVRMLEVYVYDMRVLPDVFGHLRHLRSLTISREIDEFPASLCKLHNLQVLKLTITEDSTAALPENMKNLISLRHLVTSSRYGDRICPVIARVRRLASLQVLSICIKKERDYKIDELEGLNMIRELHLQGLENVESREEASMAKLGNKEHLRVLRLEWSGDNDDDTERNINPMSKMDEQQQQILDCLQPHSSLKELTIVGGYKGVRPAKWMDFELVNNLRRISLSDCSRLEHLPSFGKLPFLKYLSLTSMPLVKQLHCDCQQLEELYLNRLKGLEELSQSDGNSGQWCPRLLQLKIIYSPKLSVLPSLSLSLQSMELGNVGLTALPKLWLDSTKRSLSSLKSLKIGGCSELTSLDKGLLLHQHYLTDLTELFIYDCDMLVDFELVDNLQSISLWHCSRLEHLPSFAKLPFLKYLELSNMPLVKQLDCDCQQLEELHLRGMVGLEELSQSDGNSGQWCPRLRKLKIEDSPKLSVLPSLSLSLQSMVLSKVGLTVLPKLWLGSTKRSSSSSSSSLPSGSVWRRLASLDWLTIFNCEELMSLEVISALQHLGHLEIINCPKLVCTATTAVATGLTLIAVDELVIDDPMLLLKESLIRNLTSLRGLQIWNCRGLESISGEMEERLLQSRTTLKWLTLHNATSLKSLPDSLQTFSSLEMLALFNAGELQSVPRLPSSVRDLHIRGCNETLKDRCRKDEGADWPNINHIPHIQIF